MRSAVAANHLYLVAAAPARARFERAAADPARAQWKVLSRILRENAECEYAVRHELFRGIRSFADYRERVPLTDYDALHNDVQRIAHGQRRVLTARPVICFEPTGGSSGPTKLVPYTQSLLREFANATQAWVFDLLIFRPGLRRGRAYWAVTPPARQASHTAGGVAIGLAHDSDYFPAFARQLLDRVLGVPRIVAKTPDVASCRYLTLRALLALPDLAFISVWNPSFLTLLAQALDEHWRELLIDLEHGGASWPLDPVLGAEAARSLGAHPRLATALRHRFGTRPPEDLGALWPGLSLISCWRDGHAARGLDGLRQRFPCVEVQGKGLLATEGVVSIPLFGAEFPVAAVTSHFLEFLPDGVNERGRDSLTVDEVEIGQTYEVALTTSGGLYRYRLRDLVRVEGFYRSTPMLRFIGRADCASDVAGEKLTPAFVESVLRRASERTGIRAPFAMLAPSWGEPPRYQMYVDASPADALVLGGAVERLLMESHHYALCRTLGQLDPLQPLAVPDAARKYEQVRLAHGQRAGAIKPVALESGFEWETAFAASHITSDALLAS